MKLNKATLLIMATSLLSASAFAQSVQEAASKFEVPTFESMTLDVHGWDLFNYSGSTNDDDTLLTMQLLKYHKLLDQ